MKKGVAVNRGWRPTPINTATSFATIIFVMPLMTSAMDFSEAEKLIKQYDSATRNYLYERITFESGEALDAKRACTELPGGGVTQILRINQDGAVDMVVSNVQTPQAECFEKLYLGRVFKAPPSAPVYIKHKVGYGGGAK